MRSRHAEMQDKQLRGIELKAVMEKRSLDQAMNAKEFAVCAGVSYSTAREWFHMPGFPALRGVAFWQDFVQWRSGQTQFKHSSHSTPQTDIVPDASKFPARAAQILYEA